MGAVSISTTLVYTLPSLSNMPNTTLFRRRPGLFGPFFPTEVGIVDFNVSGEFCLPTRIDDREET